ncbi:WD40-repeat-containing domain protein [Myxozyma melibiosi]|uniref:Elongator complex protein 2 n=1 Tax=Myxozyma melibiosi TaxID=54550 RepID=A0ABR1FA91_9ASCO
MDVQVKHIAIGANRVPAVASCCPDQKGIVAFAADRYVALWKPESERKGVRTVLKGHADPVSAVCFVTSDVIASGSTDGVVKLWRRDSPAREFEFKCPGFFPLCVALDEIRPESSTDNSQSPVYVLAIGATSTRIQVFISAKSDAPVFRKIATLKGHEDWVHSLAFKHFKEHDGDDVLYLVSGSQDRYIRLWKILPRRKYEHGKEDNFLMMADPLFASTMYKFSLATGDGADSKDKDGEYAVVFDALLMGHDDWVISLQWHPAPNVMRLLSASADSSLMIWSPDEASGIWVSEARLGDVSIKGASTATGSSGGFWTALWEQSEDPSWISTVGKSGSWRVWKAETEEGVAITGHVREVTGIAWSPTGDYLLTASLDQTTRLLAEWKTGAEDDFDWHEFARPQIHGYDMITVSCLSSTVFVSAGDEKVLRVFEMPKSVAQLLQRQCQIDVRSTKAEEVVLPDAAAVPSLGLSNKAVNMGVSGNAEDGDDNAEEETVEATTADASFESIVSLRTPPLEPHLQRHTLFPEIEKLYGHGYEISAAAISHSRKILATTCRANNTTHAVIRLFDTSTWHEIQPHLEEAHALTVTDLQFSADDRYLLSVGRDRMLVVWEVVDRDGGVTYEKRFSAPRGHSRIIWDCAWAPAGLLASGEEDYVFATASRDKTVKVWKASAEGKMWTAVATEKFGDAVTAVDIFPRLVSEKENAAEKKGLLAIGLDNGRVYVYEVCAMEEQISPVQRISRLAWRPRKRCGEGKFEVAVASDDSSVRIYAIEIDCIY